MLSKSAQAEIRKVADKNGIEFAALAAVAEVESDGVEWWKVGGRNLPAIRFEGHYFHRLLKKNPAKLKAAVAAGLANPKAGGVKNPNAYAARYALLERATAIDPDAALASTSWGMGQVMGENWKALGYGSVQELVNACRDSVAGQVDCMVRFIRAKGLKDELARHDWAGFARVYNGKAYKKNRYDSRMRAQYLAYSNGTKSAENDVAALQRDLNTLGYTVKADGVLGPRTKAAIKKLQSDNGLVADGKPGPMTKKTIRDLLAAHNRKLVAKVGATTAKVSGGSIPLTTIGGVVTEQAGVLQYLGIESTTFNIAILALVGTGVVCTIAGTLVAAFYGKTEE